MRNRPQRSNRSVNTMLGFFFKAARSVPPRRSCVVVLLVATQCSVVSGSRRSLGRRWVGKRGPRSRDGAASTKRASAQWALRRQDARVHAPFVSPAKAGAQEPRWRRCCGTDLSAVSFPPTRCSGSFEKQHSPCRGALDGSMSFWLPPSAPWSLGPGVRRENEG